MRTLFSAILVASLLTGVSAAGPDLSGGSYESVRFFSPESRQIAATSAPGVISFLVAAMKRAKDAGCNTHGLALTSVFRFSSKNKKRPGEVGVPVPFEPSKFYLDLETGHFAPVTPPKLSIFRFSKEDFGTLRKKLDLKSKHERIK